MKICSHKAAATLLTENTKKYDVILITNAFGKYDDEEHLNAICQHGNRICHLIFDDIEFPRDRHLMPELHHVQSAINFAAGKEELIVTCTAGKGRSAALAYVIACSKLEPAEAIKILDPKQHIPNEKVIFLGNRILGKPNLLSEYALFKDKLPEPGL